MSVADEISKLVALRDSGVLTADEFEAQKAKALAGGPKELGTNTASGSQSQTDEGMGLFAKIAIALGIGIALFLGFGFIVGNTPEAKEQLAAQDAIKHCWQEQERKSLTPEMSRLTASMCEAMEKQYRNKYGRNP